MRRKKAAAAPSPSARAPKGIYSVAPEVLVPGTELPVRPDLTVGASVQADLTVVAKQI